MRLVHANVRNYALHCDSTVEFAPTTVLIGRNGGGKSSLLESLILLGRLSRSPVPDAFSDTGPYSYHARLFHGADTDAGITLSAKFETDEVGLAEYQLIVRPSGGTPSVAGESLSVGEREVIRRDGTASFRFDGVLDVDAASSSLAAARVVSRDKWTPNVRLLRSCSYALGRVLRFRFDPFAISGMGSAYPDDEDGDPREPDLGFRGENTAGFLYWSRDFRNIALREIEQDMRGLAPGFEAFEFNTASPDPDKVEFSVRYADDRGIVPSRNLSAGTLSLIALLCVTRIRGRGTPPRPKVICIEEPELGLTPRATREMFERLTQLRDDSQLVVTSHSAHLWHPALQRPATQVWRVIPENGRAVVEPVREALLREDGVEGLARLRQEGGMGVEQALRTMEGVS